MATVARTDFLFACAAAAVCLSLSSPALAFGPAIGANADIAQLNSGFYDSDPASNAPNAGGVWDDLTGSNFVRTLRPRVYIEDSSSVLSRNRQRRMSITVTP